MNTHFNPEDLVAEGTVETFAPNVVNFDPNSKDGRRASEKALLKSQPNSLRDHLLRLPELADKPIPQLEFIVEGWVWKNAVCNMAGIGGGGKTTMALQMAASISRGEPWLGLPTRKARVLCFLTEDPADVCHMRAAKIANSMNLSLADLPDLIILPVVRQDTALIRFQRNSNEHEVTQVYNELRKLCFEFDIQVLVLDALHGLFDGNENERFPARTFCALLSELATDIGGAVILLSHPSKSSSQDAKNPLSGSTSWHGGVRSVIHVSDPDDLNPDARTVRLAKANYGRIGEKIEVTWRDGVFHQDAEPPQAGVFGALHRNRAERVMLEGLRRVVNLGYEPSPHSSARDKYAPRLVIAHGGEGLKEPELTRAMNRLLEDGELKLATIGPASRAKQVIIPADMASKFGAFEGGSKPQKGGAE